MRWNVKFVYQMIKMQPGNAYIIKYTGSKQVWSLC